MDGYKTSALGHSSISHHGTPTDQASPDPHQQQKEEEDREQRIGLGHRVYSTGHNRKGGVGTDGEIGKGGAVRTGRV